MPRSPRNHDSLDLLLDTVCNAFGGLILIALLVALIVQSSHQNELDDQRNGITNLEQLTIQANLELTQLQRRRSTLLAKKQPDRVRKSEEHEHNRRALQAAQERVALLKVASNEQAEGLIDGVAGLSDNINRQLQVVRKRIEELHETISLRQEEIKETNQRQISILADIEKEKESRRIRVSLPRERGIVRNSSYVIVQHGMVYILGVTDDGLETYQLSPTDTRYEAIPGAGLHPIDDRARILAALKDGYRGVQMAIYPDSFHLYFPLKELVVTSGLAWAWEPMTSQHPLVLTTSDGGHSSSAQQ